MVAAGGAVQQEEAPYFWSLPVELRVRSQKVQNTLHFKHTAGKKRLILHTKGPGVPSFGFSRAARGEAAPRLAAAVTPLLWSALGSLSGLRAAALPPVTLSTLAAEATQNPAFFPFPVPRGVGLPVPPHCAPASEAPFSPEAIKGVLLSIALRKPPAVLRSVNETFSHAAPTDFCRTQPGFREESVHPHVELTSPIFQPLSLENAPFHAAARPARTIATPTAGTPAGRAGRQLLEGGDPRASAGSRLPHPTSEQGRGSARAPPHAGRVTPPPGCMAGSGGRFGGGKPRPPPGRGRPPVPAAAPSAAARQQRHSRRGAGSLRAASARPRRRRRPPRRAAPMQAGGEAEDG